MYRGEHPIAFFVFLQVDFDIMGKKPLPHIANQIGLSYLSGSIDQQNFVLLFLEKLFDDFGKLSFKHGKFL